MNDFLYSLWVAPQGDLYQKLKKLISDLSLRFNSPIFEPHVTLLGDLKMSEEEIINKTSQLAKIISPYKITLDFIDYTDNLYQSLVIRTVATKEVVDANKKARDLFNKHTDTLYVPHVSIIYVKEMDNSQKQQLIAEIGDQFKGQEFMAEGIQISEQTASGRIEDWKTIKEVKFNG